MRKIILNVAVSLDGYITGSAGEFDWCFTDQDYGMASFLRQTDALLMGRKSYQLMLEMGNDSFPGRAKSMAKYVVSNTLDSVAEWATLIKGDVLREVKNLKEMAGKDIWLFGGAELTGSLMGAGLVDEMQLSIHPLVLGGGKALFGGVRGRVKLELVETQNYSTGLVQAIYRVEKEVAMHG